MKEIFVPEHPDWKEFERRIRMTDDEREEEEMGTVSIGTFEPVRVNYSYGSHKIAYESVRLDISDYEDIYNSPEFIRILGVRQLSQTACFHVGAVHTRGCHSLSTLYWAREMIGVLDLDEYDQKLVELYALLHDIGHLPWSHTTENIFRKMNGFSHHKNGVEKIKQLRSFIERHVDFDDLVGMFMGSKLSSIVDGEIGADRVAYINMDNAHCYLDDKKRLSYADVRKLLEAGVMNDGRYMTSLHAIDDVIRFLCIRADSYRNIYFGERTQIAEAVAENLVHLSGLTVEEIARMSDHDLTYTMKKNAELSKRIIDMEYNYHFPMLAGSLKLKGFEDDEYEIDYYEDSPLGNRPESTKRSYGIVVEGITYDEAESIASNISSYQKILDIQSMIEKGAGAERNTVFLCTTVSTNPQKKTLLLKPVPIMTTIGVKDLYEMRPDFREYMQKQAHANYSLRVVSYPDYRDSVYRYLKTVGLKELLLR